MLKTFRSISLASCVGLALTLSTGCSSTGAGALTHLAFISLRGANQIAVYRINNNTAAFTTIVGSPFAAGESPSAVIAHPSKSFIYVANQGENTISLFKVDNQSGALTEVMPRTLTGIFPSSLAMDSAGTMLFASNQASNNISAYSINSSTGALTQAAGSPFSTGSGPVKLKLTPSAKFLYVLSGNLASIYAYSITAGSGALQAVAASPFYVGPTPSSFAIDPQGNFVYVTNASASVVSVYTINSSSGALTQIPLSPFSTTTNTTTSTTSTLPVDLVPSPSGQFLYVLNSTATDISEYSIGVSGVLTLLTGSPVTLSGASPAFILFDSTNNFLFVGDQGSNTIGVLSVATDGTLTNSVSSATVGASPSSMSVLP